MITYKCLDCNQISETLDKCSKCGSSNIATITIRSNPFKKITEKK